MPSLPTPSPPATVLQISVIGGASFVYSGREIGLRNRKGRAMLAYIALNGSPQVDRDRLAGLLWSEFGQNNARTDLRQAVHEVREAMRAAGCGAMIVTRNTVGLQPGSYQLDLDRLLAAVGSLEAPDALLQQAHLAETLLAGFESLDPAFDGWLTARRQTLQDRLIRELEGGYRDTGLSRRRRRRLAEAALRLDPTHEEACRVVMRTAAEGGETSAALRAYNELYRLLDDEYDSDPSAATQALVVEIRQGKIECLPQDADPGPGLPPAVSPIPVGLREPAAPPAPAMPPPKPALFISPFATNGIDPDRAHLIEGFRLDLIACLVRFREWYVSGGAIDSSHDHQGAPVAERYLVTTTTYQAGSAINAVMVLQEQRTGLAIWSERFEVRLDQWFAAQQLVVRRFAAALNVQLSMERLARVASVPDVSLEVYDVWLRAQSLLRNFDPATWNRPMTMLTQAIERAPGWSPLYSSLVQMNNSVHIAHPGVFRDRKKEAQALAWARQAVLLDPRDSQAELCLGWSLALSKRYTQARVHIDIACELNSNDSWTLMSAALFRAFSGDAAGARQMAAQAVEMTLSPDSRHWTYYATISYLCGDDESTIAQADLAHSPTPTLIAWRAAALWNLGRKDEARANAAQFLATIRDRWFGETPPTDASIGRWLLHLYPIGHAPGWERLHAGVTAAGIPDGGMSYHGW